MVIACMLILIQDPRDLLGSCLKSNHEPVRRAATELQGHTTRPELEKALQHKDLMVRALAAALIVKQDKKATLAAAALKEASLKGGPFLFRKMAIDGLLELGMIAETLPGVVHGYVTGEGGELFFLEMYLSAYKDLPASTRVTIAPMLEHKNGTVREAGVKLIARTGPDALGLVLLAAQYDESSGVRSEARQVLGSLLPENPAAAVPALSKALRDNNPTIRKATLLVVGAVARENKAFIPVLSGASKDKDPEVSAMASFFLEAVKEGGPAWIRGLRSKSSGVRRAAIAFLNSQSVFKEPGRLLVPVLAIELRDPDRLTREDAGDTVARLFSAVQESGAPTATDLLCGALTERDPATRSSAAHLLATAASTSPEDRKKVLAALQAAASDPEAEVRAVAGISREVLAATDTKARVTGVKDPSAFVRLCAVKSMSEPRPELVESLRLLFKDPDSHVRQSVTEAVRRLLPASRGLFPEGVLLQDDADGGVRFAAFLTLENLGDGSKEWEAILVKSLARPEASIRHAAIVSLSSVRSPGPETRAALVERLKDSDEAVRKSAEVLLKVLETRGATKEP